MGDQRIRIPSTNCLPRRKQKGEIGGNSFFSSNFERSQMGFWDKNGEFFDIFILFIIDIMQIKCEFIDAIEIEQTNLENWMRD